MKIAFFTEMGFSGKVPRGHSNMRTEFAWMVALEADHYNLNDSPTQYYQLGIVIIPKNVKPYLDVDVISNIKRSCKNVAFMQEGPSWYYQSLPLRESMWFLEQMMSVDLVLAHNDIDMMYYEGLLEKPTYINPTLMITDSLRDLPNVERSGIIMGGNLGRWYGGINSYMVALESNENISAPQMGRMDKDELNVDGISHLPYLDWHDWMFELNKFKYAIHLNPNTIGGTFSLNCAYLGIPCIGNVDSNTQRLCFPDLSVKSDDLKSAKNLMIRLKTDTEFYNNVSERAKEYYEIHFSERNYKQHWKSLDL